MKLREMLIRTNMEDMREKTHTRHYELYRQKRLEQMGFTDVDSDNKPVISFLYIEFLLINNCLPFFFQGFISANF